MPYFRASQLFWLRLPYLWIQSLLWWISIVSYFDIQVNPCWNRTLTYHFSTSISLNHDWTLGGACYIHLTMKTNVYYKQILPCIQMFPLKRLPTIGSPMRSFLFIHTLNIISLHDTFMQYIFSFVMIFFSSVNSIISPSTLYWSLSMPYGMKYVVTIERISSFWILLVMDEYK